MHEELAFRLEPARDLGQERLVVTRMLEHLDAQHPVEAAIDVEHVGVGGEDLDRSQTTVARLALDERPLRAGVRYGKDSTRRIALGQPERQRSPATSEVEDLHPVLDLGALTGQRQHRLLGGCERIDAVGPEAAGVLQSWAEHELKELRRHLVVLLVRLLDLAGDLGCPQLVEERLLARSASTPFACKAPGAVGADRPAHQRIRNQSDHRVSTSWASFSQPVRKAASHEPR